MTQGRMPPSNLDAERALIGILIERNDSLFDVTGLVGRDDFLEPLHGELFLLIRDQVESGRHATPLTLMHDMAQDADIGGIKASDYLRLLVNEAPPPSIARDLARTIRDLASRRKAIEAAGRWIEDLHSAPASTTAIEINSRYESIFGSLFTSIKDMGIQWLPDVERDVVDRVGTALRNETTAGMTTGMAAWDDLMGPLTPGCLYVLVAPPGMGKTALAQQIGEYVAKTLPVLMIEAEMEADQLATRHMASKTGIPSTEIRRGKVSLEQAEDLAIVADQSRSLNFYIDAMSEPSLAAIRGKAVRMKRLRGLSLLIVDHLHEMASPDQKMQEFEAQRHNTRGLRRLAGDLQIPIILLSHVSHDFDKQDKVRRPSDGDIYGGSSTKRAAHALVFLWREDYALLRKEPPKPSPSDTDSRVSKEWNEWADRLGRAKGKAELIKTKDRDGDGFGIRTVVFKDGRFYDRHDQAPIFQGGGYGDQVF